MNEPRVLLSARGLEKAFDGIKALDQFDVSVDAGEVIGLVTLKAIFQENIAFALPINYLQLFLNNEKAFAFDKSNPNRAYRYLPPAPYDPKEKAKNKEEKTKDDKSKDKVK